MDITGVFLILSILKTMTESSVGDEICGWWIYLELIYLFVFDIITLATSVIGLKWKIAHF